MHSDTSISSRAIGVCLCWIKRSVRGAARRMLESDSMWTAIQRTFPNIIYFRVQRTAAREARFQRRCRQVFSARTVLAGPFKGLRYPQMASIGSALYPKLIGSYEAELHAVVESVCRRPYECILDIGFAEGYYLVGLARLFPSAQVIGVDVSTRAHQFCRRLAALNGITGDRLTLYSRLGEEARRLLLGHRALVVCDCEGAEVELFVSTEVARWTTADLLIECHDFLRPGASSTLTKLFAPTHAIRTVTTQHWQTKISFLQSPAFRKFDREERQRLLDEGRPAAQSWIIAETRAAVG